MYERIRAFRRHAASLANLAVTQAEKLFGVSCPYYYQTDMRNILRAWLPLPQDIQAGLLLQKAVLCLDTTRVCCDFDKL